MKSTSIIAAIILGSASVSAAVASEAVEFGRSLLEEDMSMSMPIEEEISMNYVIEFEGSMPPMSMWTDEKGYVEEDEQAGFGATIDAVRADSAANGLSAGVLGVASLVGALVVGALV
ncbi:predicted protein [Thalassiosira pseudonana CCMP1335]|uniref:Uncharacterized protein n=1 Tax=Thalassiosira pseudonana TaxID=35128 RepID=B8LBS3_THAPS|nr:predicted protein [Thalassiosira pseudonana CCMP1335]EED87099.1 predicted protein [Thalassiosira pseudonana CCMP1335]